METRFEPNFIEDYYSYNNTLCYYCNSILLKQVKKSKYLKKECGYCRYSDRPFAMGSSTLENNYSGCNCEYGEKDFNFIICNNCLNINCKICNIKIYTEYLRKPSLYCYECKETYKKKELEKKKQEQFNIKWKNFTEKRINKFNKYQKELDILTLKMLKEFAKNKNIKNYNKYKKQHLIDILIPLINDEDFDNEYILVPYKEKDIAKKFGAEWDSFKKSWYIPFYLNNSSKKILLETYKKKNI